MAGGRALLWMYIRSLGMNSPYPACLPPNTARPTGPHFISSEPFSRWTKYQDGVACTTKFVSSAAAGAVLPEVRGVRPPRNVAVAPAAEYTKNRRREHPASDR